MIPPAPDPSWSRDSSSADPKGSPALPLHAPVGTDRPPVVGAVRFHPRTMALLLVTSLIGLAAFLWPLLYRPDGEENLAHAVDAPWLFVLLLPMLLAIVASELSDGTLDAKGIALLGVLSACGAALRLPGVAGFEPIFFLLLPAGRVLGRGFGFVLGAVTLFASALLTGGVGPWLPFQMLGAAWVGFFAGCLPARLRGKAEVGVLAAYGAVAGLAYGFILNMWFWPYSVTEGGALSYVAGAPVAENLSRFWAFHLATSFGWDLPRAATNVALVLLLGGPVLAALRRATRKAAFDAPVAFEPSVVTPT